MPHHVHAVIAFKNTPMPINTIIGNGKRFIAYGLINLLNNSNNHLVLSEMQHKVNDTDKKKNKLHEVFEPSFDWKECPTDDFIQQKLHYMHYNPCKCLPMLAATPEEYIHSSAKFYILQQHGTYPVTSYTELHDIDLTR
jgi:hypothetical protein